MRTESLNRMMIGLSLLVVAEAITGLLWAGGAAARLSQLELESQRTVHLLDRTARLEEQTEHIRATLIRIETKIDDSKNDE